MMQFRLLLRLPAGAPETLQFDLLCRRHFGLDPEASDEDAVRGVLRSSLEQPTATDAELLLGSLCEELRLEPGSPPLAILRAYVEYGEDMDNQDGEDVDGILADAPRQLGLEGASDDVVLAAYLRDDNNLGSTASDFEVLLAWLREVYNVAGASVRQLLIILSALEINLSWENTEGEVVERLFRKVAGVVSNAPSAEIAEAWYRLRCGEDATGEDLVVEAVKDVLALDVSSTAVDAIVRWTRREIRVSPEVSDEDALIEWLRDRVQFPNADTAAENDIKAAWLMQREEYAGWVDEPNGFIGRAYRNLLEDARGRIETLDQSATDGEILDAALRAFEGLPLEATWAEAFAAAVKSAAVEEGTVAHSDGYATVLGAVVRADLALRADESDASVLDVLVGAKD